MKNFKEYLGEFIGTFLLVFIGCGAVGLSIFSTVLTSLLHGFVLYFAFAEAISLYEQSNQIIRGSETSIRTAMMFGEYFPNPSYADTITVSYAFACFMEGIGTFMLVFIIFRLTNKEGQIPKHLIPVLIGFTVTLLICIIAPYTQGGFNPARDFSPRIIAYLAGWKSAAFPTIKFSFFTVYILSPILGGIAAAYFNRILK